MVKKLLVVWFLAVIAFFVLWSIVTMVIKHISKRKEQEPSDPEF